MNNVIGAGLNPAPPSQIHDAHYDVEVYPASIPGAVLDIMVPAHGKLNLTMQCVKSIYDFTQKPFHLLVLDDAPPDDYGLTERWLRQLQTERPNLTYIRSNIPFKCGNTFFNVALKYCKTEYLVTAMNSMTVEPNWETVALELMAQDAKIGTIGFKCLFPNGLIESAGIVFQGHIPTDFGRDWPGYRCNEIREAQAVQWAFALHRVAALRGNLDEDLFHGHVGWDDIDNCMVVKSKGWKILYCGQGVGIHAPRATRGSNSEEAHIKNQENGRLFFKRWGLWEQFIEGSKMDVSAILKYDTKAELSRGVTRIQVLKDYLQQEQARVQAMVNAAMKEIGVDPGQYLLEMNPQINAWNLKRNAKAEAVVETQPVEEVRPASDTESKQEVAV